jgi:hypothetical protein
VRNDRYIMTFIANTGALGNLNRLRFRAR